MRRVILILVATAMGCEMAIAASGETTPLEYMLRSMRDERAEHVVFY